MASARSRSRRKLNAELARTARFRTELRRFLRRTDAVTARSGLTSQRYDLLLMIRVGEVRGMGVRVTDLCELLQLRQTAVTGLVKRAEEAGLIERVASAEDGRVSLLRLTAAGEDQLVRVFNALRKDRESLAEAFAELDASFQAAGA
jgi:DNA-binding MarR family transcriptional regulator